MIDDNEKGSSEAGDFGMKVGISHKGESGYRSPVEPIRPLTQLRHDHNLSGSNENSGQRFHEVI